MICLSLMLLDIPDDLSSKLLQILGLQNQLYLFGLNRIKSPCKGLLKSGQHLYLAHILNVSDKVRVFELLLSVLDNKLFQLTQLLVNFSLRLSVTLRLIWHNCICQLPVKPSYVAQSLRFEYIKRFFLFVFRLGLRLRGFGGLAWLCLIQWLFDS